MALRKSPIAVLPPTLGALDWLGMTTWNPAEYARSSAGQKQWAEELLSSLSLIGDEAILDLGCGDGKITGRLAQAVARGRAVGIDSSEEMIRYAQANYQGAEYPNLRFRLLDVLKLDYVNEFDLVFSNAALHWVKDHRAVLEAACRALRRGGRLVLSFGGKGNGSDVLRVAFALSQMPEWREHFLGFAEPYSFYAPEEYRPWLQEARFETKRVELIPKDMVHHGKEGMAAWVRTTWMPIINRVPEPGREDFIRDLCTAYLQDFPPDADGNVHVRMVRLEVEARKPLN